MKIKICKCAQCSGARRSRRTSVRKKLKRYTSKLLRRMKPGDMKNWYWA